MTTPAHLTPYQDLSPLLCPGCGVPLDAPPTAPDAAAFAIARAERAAAQAYTEDLARRVSEQMLGRVGISPARCEAVIAAALIEISADLLCGVEARVEYLGTFAIAGKDGERYVRYHAATGLLPSRTTAEEIDHVCT